MRASVRLRILLLTPVIAFGSAGATTFFSAWQSDEPRDATLCDSIDDVPVDYTIDYQSAIQGLFNDHCIACHTNPKEAPPAAGLDLTGGISWSQIVNQPSSQAPNLIRVRPNRPDRSLLFHKLNCARPRVGARMPADGPPYLTIEEQALVHDWIAAGAPSGTTDVLFRSGFEVRD